MITQQQWDARRKLLAEQLPKPKREQATLPDGWIPCTKYPDLPPHIVIDVYIAGYLCRKELSDVTEKMWQLSCTKWRIAS